MLSPTLQTYVEAVRDAVVSRGETPGTEELRVMTARIGVIARELADAEEPANTALSRGELALRNGRPDVAMREFATAYALRPWDPATTAGLSRALIERAKETHSPDDVRRAKTWALRTLETEPNNAVAKTTQDEAANLERTFEAPRRPVNVPPPGAPRAALPVVAPVTTAPQPSSNAGVGIAIVVVLGFVVMGVGAGIYFALGNMAATDADSDGSGAQTVATTTPPNALTSSASTTGSTVPTTIPTSAPTENGAAGSEVVVPLSMVMPPGRGLDAVTLDAISSELRVYDGQDYYVLSAVLANGSGQELRSASALVQLYDAAGTVVASQRLELLATFQAALMPHDRHGVGVTVAAPDTVRRAVIQVETVDAGPAPRESQPTLRDAAWTFAPPAGMMAGIYERTREYTPGFGSQGHQRIDMLVRNSGSTSIGWMKISLTFVDTTGAAISAVDAIAVSTSEPPLAPGETRPFRVLTNLPPTWRDYAVRVIEAR